MTSPAQGASDFDARYGGRIGRVGGVICGRAVAVLALNSREMRGDREVGETAWQLVPHSVAGQARTVGLIHDRQDGKSTGMGGMHYRVENFRVALRAGLSSRVLRYWARDAEEGVAGKRGDRGLAEQAGGAHGLPTGVLKRLLLEELVGTRWPVPRHAHAIGEASHSGHDGQPGHTPRLSGG
jgi:hypothetical protein